MLNAMRVLTDPADTGAVTIALPQDVQAEAYDWPLAFFPQARLACGPPVPGARRTRARGRDHPVGEAPAHRRRWRGRVCRCPRPNCVSSLLPQAFPVADTHAGKGAIGGITRPRWGRGVNGVLGR